MNQDEFNESFHGKPEPIEEHPRVQYQTSVSALEKAHDSAVYAGRIMLGAATGAIGFGGLTFLYASKDDAVTATLCGIIAATLGAGAAYARRQGGQYLRLETQLRVKHSGIKATYDRHLKEEDLNQRRSQGHNV